MSSSPEQIFDLSEIVDLYKEDARKMVAAMQAAAQRWGEVFTGGPARYELRKLSHQLRGSGRTYGFCDVTRLSKAIERLMIKIEQGTLPADERVQQSIGLKIERLSRIFAKQEGS